MLVVLQVPAAAAAVGSFVAHHVHVLGLAEERVFAGVEWLYGTVVCLVLVAVICDLGTHYSSFDVLVVFELVQVLLMSVVKDAVEMELRALRSLGELG